MSQYRETTRRFAALLEPGDLVLSNRDLREMYGIGRVTAKARTEIAEELERCGLKVLSDPDYEPLEVHKEATRRPGAVVGAPPPHRPASLAAAPPRSKRRWAVALAAVLVFLAVVGALSDDSNEPGTQPASAPPPAQTTPAQAPSEPVKTLADAEDAVQDDAYQSALLIAAGLSADDESYIARRIARRLARRTMRALGVGDRSRARRLLAEADDYPTTDATRRARASYRAAQDRASARAKARRQQRAEARRQCAAARAEAQAPAVVEEPPAPIPTEPDVEPSGPSTTNWCGKRDGDGDGLYCE